MGKRPGFIKTTIFGGLVFLIPLVFLVGVVGKAVQMMMLVAEPVSRLFPDHVVGGIALVNLLALFGVLLACFLAGLVAQSRIGKRLFRSVDDTLMLLIPGYALLKHRIVSTIRDEEEQSLLKSVLVRFDDQYQIAFEVERVDRGLVAVFLPGAPDPWSGSIVFVEEDRVEPLEIDTHTATQALQRLGRGSAQMLEPQTETDS